MAVIPDTLKSLPKVYIDTPGSIGIESKEDWVDLCTIRIVGDNGEELFQKDSLKVKGRGNTTWWIYPKKPYTLKLKHQANLFGTGKSKRYVLLANWMDRTLLRNDIAFEAARRTSMEWTPSGRFVELYLNGRHLGNYWLGEKVNAEGSKFKAEFLYSFDISDMSETDFWTPYGYQPNSRQSGLPVELKYPDRDDYEGTDFQKVLATAKERLNRFGDSIRSQKYADMMAIDTFCDWYLVHELTWNLEPNHPKSCDIYMREGRFYAGPVWDFDWYTFVPGGKGLGINNSIYYKDLLKDPAFMTRMKERWAVLKPEFESLPDYIDRQAATISSSVAVDKVLWPCWSTVNGDESLSFPDAVKRLKQSLQERISELDKLFGQ